ncbi:putative extracellular serine/threonine protein kinase FAM20C [Apostichopus japonicus]|uniref:Putative extracellular serine/threonine protein kinase FAM20C n=1 Tax=Stichopus japonicus TaxID=307972 RepID=A0A2G8JVF9_STIJA|nr:putative extracellular serine/threonine protein kinase FAM20C [Apostichopus japonicus]
MALLIVLGLLIPDIEKDVSAEIRRRQRIVTSSVDNLAAIKHPISNPFLKAALEVDDEVDLMPKAGQSTEQNSSLEEFHNDLTLDSLYSVEAPYMPRLLHSLATAPIKKATVFSPGTQFKILLEFENGNFAIAKPMRHKRDFYWAYNKTQQNWQDQERHTAEIASFHLDRVMGFRRVPPCVGRKVDFLNEILMKGKDDGLLDTMTWRGDDICFIGDCAPVFCNKNHTICAENGTLEISVCQKIPGRRPFHEEFNPWNHYITLRDKTSWKYRNICTDILKKQRITRGRFFLDLMELVLFDHLIRNYDRHHYFLVNRIDRNMSFVVIVDNGKGFGNPYEDDIKCLAAIYQCCRFRNSTFNTMLALTKEGNKLGDLVKASLSKDPLAPILLDDFFPALDRRLLMFINEIYKCVSMFGQEKVLVGEHVTT